MKGKCLTPYAGMRIRFLDEACAKLCLATFLAKCINLFDSSMNFISSDFPLGFELICLIQDHKLQATTKSHKEMVTWTLGDVDQGAERPKSRQ